MVAYVRAQMLWRYVIRTWDSSAQGFATAETIARGNSDQAFTALLQIAYQN